MRLKTIILNNFRCFDSLTLELHPRLTVIVGENGAGKTALLDGIASVFTPAMTYFSSANQRLAGRGIKDTDFRVEPYDGRGGKVYWGTADFAQVQAETFDGIRWDYWRPSAGAKGASPETKWGETALKEHVSQIVSSYKTQNPALTPVLAYYGASRGHIEVPERLRGAKNNYNHPTAALVDCFNPRSDFREMLEWFDLEESSELRQNKGVDSDSYDTFRSLEAVRAAVIGLLGEFSNPHFNQKHKFMLRRNRDNAPMLVNQLSQGYQSMLALAMDFARRLAIANSQLEYGDAHAQEQIFQAIDRLRALPGGQIDELSAGSLTTYAPAIMLVDEIDLHLHPTWQQRVLGDLMRTFPLTQFVVTTHSPQVLTSVDASCIRKLVSVTDADTGRSRMDVQTVTLQTRGVASADVLATIMGVNPVPDLLEANQLSNYHALIQQNLQDSDEGRELRSKLLDHFSAEHPVMLECDRMIRLQAFKQRLSAKGPSEEGAA